MSKRPAAGIETYQNERVMWQLVLERNGLTINARTHAEAIHIIQRMHVYRALDRKHNTRDGTWSVFDDYVIKNPGKAETIIIERRMTLDQLTILYPDGTPADLDAARRDIDYLDEGKSRQFFREQGIKESDINKAFDPPHDIDPDKPLDLE